MGLTYDEVAETGVFAWRDDGYLHVDGRLLRIRSGDPQRLEVTPSALHPGDPAQACFRDRRWRHLPDCDCDHCRHPERGAAGHRVGREMAVRRALT